MRFSAKRLLILSSSSVYGGLEKYSAVIATAALNSKWETYIGFPRTEHLRDYIQTLKQRGCNYIPINISQVKTKNTRKRICKNIIHYLRTLIILVKVNPDVVQIGLPWPDQCFGSILACATFRIPTVVVFQLAPQKIMFSALQLHFYRWGYRRNQCWIAVSNSNLQTLQQTFSSRYFHFRCIYNGVEEPQNYPDSDKRRVLSLQLRKKLHVSNKAYFLITVGRLHPQKGFHILIPTISKLIKYYPEIKLLWCGELAPEYREYLSEILQKYPNVRSAFIYLGYQNDIPSLLYSSDIFVFPTLYEGISFALLEAISCGIPVIASDIGPNREVITSGVNGILFRNGDENDLYEKIHWALQHLEKVKAMAQRQRKLPKQFTETHMIRETLKLLKSISKGGKIKNVNITHS